jgi:peptide/nickel transport system substrate-binding protein
VGERVLAGRDLRTRVISVAVIASMLLCIPIALDSDSDKLTKNSSTSSELRIGFLQSIDSMNPYVGLNDASYIFYGLVYDALNVIDNKMQPTMDLAKNVTQVPTTDPYMVAHNMPAGSVWEYEITQNAYWTDGEPFTADDVVYNIWLNAEVTHYDSMWAYQPYSYFMHEAWKVNDYTVRISFWNRETGVPMPCAYAYLISIPMLPKHMLENFAYSYIGMDWTGVFYDTQSPGMPIVGTGPFMATPNIYSEWLAGDHITLVKNPNCHWAYDYGKTIKFDKLTLRFFQDSTSMVLALKNKDIDVASYPPTAYQSIRSQVESGTLANVSVFNGPKITQYWTEIAINENDAGPNPSRLDPVVRQAMHMATNKQYIIDNFYLGLGEVGTTLIPPINTQWHYEPTDAEKANFAYNLTAAAALLQANGYIDVDYDGIRECTIDSPAVQMGLVPDGTKMVYEMLVRKEHPEEKYIAMYLKATWAQIGIVINYLVVEELTMSGAAYSYAYDTLIWYWSADIDPNYQLFTLSSYAINGWNDCHYASPAYDRAYTYTVNTTDPVQRKQWVDEAQRIFYNDSPYIILTYPSQTCAWRNDTFSGWGNWSLDPGRSIDNFWMGNPLFFDLSPLGVNAVPAIYSLDVNPNPVLPGVMTNLTVTASDRDADALSFYIDFGDGETATTVGTNTTDLQYANFIHSYASPGLYSVTVYVDDTFPEPEHNVSQVFDGIVLVGSSDLLEATIVPSDVTLDIGATFMLRADLTWNGELLDPAGTVRYQWSINPSDIGSFDYRARRYANLTAGPSFGEGLIVNNIAYYGIMFETVTNLTVNPPVLDHVSVSPSSKTITPGGSCAFEASAIMTDGAPATGVNYSWSVTADAGVTYALNTSAGSVVLLTVGLTLGNLMLSATGDYGGMSRTGCANVTIGYPPQRTMDYVWYDMFNVPIQSWYYKRWEIYKQEEPWTTSYPWIFLYHSSPEGNLYTYTLMRLNITGRNVSEINSNERPEFLPILSPTERGGTINIGWYMQYLTSEELQQRYGQGIANQDDGWIIDLNGTVTLDKQAAKMVMNLTDTGWDSFADWWSSHDAVFNYAYADWLVSEAEGRVDIENTYQSYFQLFSIDINAQKVGDKIVLTCDILTWGMEALMLRWLHESFLPMEEWYEDMNFNMKIMPEYSTVDIDTAVTHAAYATDSIDRDGDPMGAPVWAWQPSMGDVVPSSPAHPISLYDKYVGKTYLNRQADSPLFNTYMAYDYVPAAWNLTGNETLTFIWPSGDQLFRYTVTPGLAVNLTDEMVVTYSEPTGTDFPGQIVVDNINNTLIFTGPIDMWDWSRNQTAHTYLQDEYGRVGLLPYGMPWVEFKKKYPVEPQLDHYRVQTVSSAPAGDSVTFDVTAFDQYDNVYEDYAESVNFSSSDPLASLPSNYTFVPATDHGTHEFVGGARFETEGNQTLVAQSASGELRYGQADILILPRREASYFLVSIYHLPALRVSEDVTVSVYDQYGDLFVNYTGTVTFDTNRKGKVTMPADYTFQLSDAGVHTFASGLDFKDTGWFTITVSEKSNPSVAGSQTDIYVVPNPEIIDHFTVAGIQDMITFEKSDVTVHTFDQYGYPFLRYNGTVHFSANQTGGVFPLDYTFEESDLGAKTFVDGVWFTLAGVYTVTVEDTVNPSATGSQSDILIEAMYPSETFRMYDLFQQPWGDWWVWRYPAYHTDIILTNETGKYTMLYNPDMRGIQGIIYAPYRWNITGANMTAISIDHPEFMPVIGASVPGASAKVEIYFQYLYQSWWDNYWSPVWHFPGTVMQAQKTDGWYPGITYNITMNRAAAEEWMGMPQTADPIVWWYTNASTYIAEWEAWILNEGNVRLDIWNAYEWPYVDLGTKMKMSVLANGDIYLQIGHLGEGYEILMTRWLNETMLCNHEPYYEDMSLNVQYYSNWANLSFDAVCQYGLRAVKATESMTNEGAWAWEPQLIDYVSSGNGHPSTYDPWEMQTYLSRNAGDPLFGHQVCYGSGVTYFNLTDYQTFIIQLPLGNNVLGYYAQESVVPRPIVIIIVPPAGSGYDRYPRGNGTNYDYEGYWPIMYNGSMTLGYYGNWIGPLYLETMYDPVTNTIVMVGPLRFDNDHLPNGALSRGAPWIEFNVTPVAHTDTSPPIAIASADPNPADFEDTVSLNGSLSIDDVGIVDYNWTFIYDGVPQELHGQVVQFVFLTPGIYDITLNCTDAAGNYNTTSIQLVVNPVIPEFGSVTFVMFSLLAVFIAVRRLRRRRKD